MDLTLRSVASDHSPHRVDEVTEGQSAHAASQGAGRVPHAKW